MNSKFHSLAVPGAHPTMRTLAGLVLSASLLLPASVSFASNLLVNGDFNSSLAGTWTTWAYGGGWANQEIVTPAAGLTGVYDGTLEMSCGGAGSAGGGVYQIVPVVAGYTYTLSVQAGAQDWWRPQGEMRLFFMDATNGILSSTNPIIVAPADYDTGSPWSNYTMNAIAPAGTKWVKVEFAMNGVEGGTVWFDNASLTTTVETPDISNLYPDGGTLLQATNALTFTATSGSALTNIQVVLNGADVSSSLDITGSDTSKNVSAALETNKTYTAAITVQDANGFSITRNLRFDTYAPDNFSWEAEDYDFNSGSYIDQPVLSSTPGPNNYYQQAGTLDTDYHDITGNGDHPYRPFDLMATEATGDVPRQTYLDAQVGDPGVADYDVDYFDGGEWLNYTRTFPSGVFNVYARMSSPGSATLNLAQVTGGWGTASQTTASVGNFILENGLGWGTFSWVPLRDANGNLVKLNLGGTNTLRATSSGNCNLQFFLLVPANTNLPSIADLYPNGATLFQQTNGLSFTAESDAGINDGSIQVTLYVTNLMAHYVTNLTSANGLVLSGPNTRRQVSYDSLTSNTLYRAVIAVTDINNNTVTSSVKFDTYAPLLTWEAEDWDYGGGQYINNPAVDAYAGLTGVEGIDYHDINASGGTPYRYNDAMSAEVSSDTPRIQYVLANTNDYSLGWFVNGEWVNYTRNFPSGTYNIYGRFSAGDATSYQTLSQVTNGMHTSSQELRPLGTFNIASTGSWGDYAWTPLRDAFGNLASVTLNGVTTLRLTKTGGSDANVNFFMLLPAETSLPTITAVAPMTFLQSTNRLTFTATSAAGIATTNIVVILNGVDVSSLLQFSGSSTSWNVSCAGLAPNATYTAVITVIDDNGFSASSTVSFDTFSAANYTWEAEDWDYNGGQFLDNPQTNGYAGLAGLAGIDYFDTGNGGGQAYRDPTNTAATEVASDFMRPQYNQTGFTNYDVGYTATGEWENYTRTYPTGTFNVYLRAARGTAGTAPLGLAWVTAGWGTTNQTTAPLGSFAVPNTGGWQTYQWVLLKDANGRPVNLTLGGTNTLRITDGGANLDFFTLVPALALRASVSSGNMLLSFGTQPGFNYTVQYKNELTDPDWTSLGTSPGDGTTMTVSDSPGTTRFYRLEVH